MSRCRAACGREYRLAARMAASGGCICMQQLEQHALLEQMIVEGALCSKASCVVLVKPVALLRERARERGRETK